MAKQLIEVEYNNRKLIWIDTIIMQDGDEHYPCAIVVNPQRGYVYTIAVTELTVIDEGVIKYESKNT